MRRFLLLSALGILGCRPTYDSVDAACPGRIPGQAKADAGAISAFLRVSCYRRSAWEGRARVDYRVDQAATSHARYFSINGVSANTNLLAEDANAQGFTGADPLARVLARGFPVSSGEKLGFWEGVFPADASVSPEALVDGLMPAPYTRQGVLQPLWRAGGYGTDGGYTVLTILYDFPADQHVNHPVFWPRDGATDVPTSWDVSDDDGVVPPDQTVGYPITFTVGSNQSGSNLAAANPYDLLLRKSSITGPDGTDVSHWAVTPDNSALPLLYTIALVPEQPLDPGTTYTVTVRAKWNAHPTASDFEMTFTTAAAGQRAAPVPPPLSIAWGP